MEKTHLAKLLLTLSNKEFKLLRKWVASPFFNQRQDVIQLLDFYLDYQKEFQKIPTKLQIFNQLFPNEIYDDHKVRMTMSFLNRLTERFLIYQNQQTSALEDKLGLLKVYRKRGLEKPYHRVAKEIEKKIAETPQRNANYYRFKFRFHQELYESSTSLKRFFPKDNLQDILHNLDKSILIEKIQSSMVAMNHERVAPVKYDLGLYDRLKESLIDDPTLLEQPVIATYYAAILVILNNDQRSYFDDYYEKLEQNYVYFSQKELFELYHFATNSLMRQFVSGNKACLQELLLVYKRQIALGLYKETINHYAFKNIVVTAIRNKAFDWAEQFIRDFSPKLPEKHRQSITNVVLASLKYRQQKYQEALALIIPIKFEDVIHNMATRVLISKIYYDLEELETLQQYLKTFELYIRRLKDGRYFKKGNYLEWVLFFQRMLRLNPHNKSAKAKLLQKLKASTYILEKEWLTKRLEEL